MVMSVDVKKNVLHVEIREISGLVDVCVFAFFFQVKFNQALADHSMSDRPRLIDGIVLTKFDTIDDKVQLQTIPQFKLFVYCLLFVYLYCFFLLGLWLNGLWGGGWPP